MQIYVCDGPEVSYEDPVEPKEKLQCGKCTITVESADNNICLPIRCPWFDDSYKPLWREKIAEIERR